MCLLKQLSKMNEKGLTFNRFHRRINDARNQYSREKKLSYTVYICPLPQRNAFRIICPFVQKETLSPVDFHHSGAVMRILNDSYFANLTIAWKKSQIAGHMRRF